MDTIRVCNLRGLADTKTISIKPITLLVGANSSGKSSFIRVFPLLKQSTETKTVSGLLLNEGDVNFGFFNEALHRDADPAELKLEFGVRLLPRAYFNQNGVIQFLISETPVCCALTYAKRSKEQRYPYLRSVRLELNSGEAPDVIEVIANEEGKVESFTINEYKAETELAKLRLRIGRGLVPSLIRAFEENDDISPISEETDEFGEFDQKLISETSHLFHGLTTSETRLSTLTGIRIGSPSQMLQLAKVSGVSSWNQRIKDWTVENPTFKKLRNILIARATSDILLSTNAAVTGFARSVHYFQPVRASVQRDYLSRDVQVNTVDPAGLNVAMVLVSWRPAVIAKFREWTRLNLGFEIFPQTVGDGARIALRMKDGAGTEFNLADMGFGFSQMLPFLVQTWQLMESDSIRGHNRNRYYPSSNAMDKSYLIVIEQPELHLHPALQSKLADLFVSMLKLSREKGVSMRFMLETHSPTIIERIGQFIEANHLSPDDVQVLLFEKPDSLKPNNAIVRKTKFNEEGILTDWPFGFLSPPTKTIPPINGPIISDTF